MEILDWVSTLLDWVLRYPYTVGALILFLAAMIEYVFPPFPGDLITLFGTYLVLRGAFGFGFALSVVTAGSLLGVVLDYQLGAWLGQRLDRLPREAQARWWTPLTREKYALLEANFRRYGIAYIVLNRFLPGIRAFFFVVAGASGMPIWKVLGFAAISATLWNTMLLLVGTAIGSNWERLQGWFSSYTKCIWVLIGSVLLGVVVRAWIRRRRAA